MTSKKETDFHKKARDKGWTLEDVGKRWDVGVRQMSRVANNPKQKDLDAVNGLPKQNKNKE